MNTIMNTIMNELINQAKTNNKLIENVNKGYKLFNAIIFCVNTDYIIDTTGNGIIEKDYTTNRTKISLLIYFVCFYELVPNPSKFSYSVSELAKEIRDNCTPVTLSLIYKTINEMIAKELKRKNINVDDNFDTIIQKKYNKIHDETIKKLSKALNKII